MLPSGPHVDPPGFVMSDDHAAVQEWSRSSGAVPRPSPAALPTQPICEGLAQAEGEKVDEVMIPPPRSSGSARTSAAAIAQPKLCGGETVPGQIPHEPLTGAHAQQEHLITAHAGQEDVRRRLLTAAKEGDEDAVKELLAAGADLEAVDEEGQTALMVAARKGHAEVVEALLAAGAKKEATDKDGRTPLILAAKEGDEDTVEALLQADACVDATDKDGRTPLLWALITNGRGRVRPLLKAGANANVVDKRGVTPVFVTIAQQEAKFMLKLLLEAGARVETADKDALQPLVLAVILGNADIANMLVAHGASASGLPVKLQALRRQLQGKTDLFRVFAELTPSVTLADGEHEAKDYWSQDPVLRGGADLPAELLAFHCRTVLAAGREGDYVESLVTRLAQGIRAAWPAVYCAPADPLEAGPQTVMLLQELAGRRHLADAVRLLHSLRLEPSGCLTLTLDGDKRPTCAAFSPDGRRLALGTAKQIMMVDLATGAQYSVQGNCHRVSCLAFSPDSSLVAGGHDGIAEICVYEAATGKAVSPVITFGRQEFSFMLVNRNGSPRALSFSADGTRLVCLTTLAHLYVYNTEDWKEAAKPSLDCTGSPTSAATLCNGTDGAMRLAIARIQPTKEVRLYTLPPVDQPVSGAIQATALLQHTGAGTGPVEQVGIRPGGAHVATLLPDGHLQLWEWKTGGKVGDSVSGPGGAPYDLHSRLAFSPDGRRLAVGTHKTVLVHECSDDGIGPVLACLHGHSNYVDSLAFSPNGQHLVTGGVDREIRFWSATFGNNCTLPGAAVGSSASAGQDPDGASSGGAHGGSSAGPSVPNTLFIRSCFRRPLFYGGAERLIPIAYTPPHDGGDGGSIGAFSSPWVTDEGRHVDVAARGSSFGVFLYDLLRSPAAQSSDALRAAASFLAPHTCAAASMAVLHLGPSGAVVALLGVAWTKLLEAGLHMWTERVARREAKGEVKPSEAVGSHYTVSISEVALPHAALALQAGVLGPVMTDPWVPMALWAKPAIKALVLLRWERFTKHVVLYEFLIRAAYIGLFVAYALRMTGGGDWDVESGSCVAGGASSGQHGLMYALAIMTAEYAAIELRQLAAAGWRWLNHTNLFDLAGLALMTAILSLHWSCGASLDTLRGLSAVLILVLFWRLLSFASSIDKLGRFVRMVLQVTADLRFFFVVLFVIYVGFALAVLALGTDLQQASDGGGDGGGGDGSGSSSGGYDAAVGALARPVFMRLYSMIYGDFGLDWVLGANAPSGPLANLAAVICSIYMFLVAIILLNLLIAVIGDAYEGVMQTAEVHEIREKAQLIAETEALLPGWLRRWRDGSLFRCQRVLVLQPAATEQPDGSSEEGAAPPPSEQAALQGRIGRMQGLVEGLGSKMERRVEALEGKLERRVDGVAAAQGGIAAQQGAIREAQSRLEEQMRAMQEQLGSMQALLQRMAAAPGSGSGVQAAE